MRFKNIILLSIDSLRSDFISRNSPAQIPWFDKLREEGIFFKNTIVQAPFTVPSHASMLTGMYPFHHGMRDQKGRLPKNISTIFSISKNANLITVSLTSNSMLKNRGFSEIDHIDKLTLYNVKTILKKLKNQRFFIFMHYWGVHTPYDTRLPVKKPKDLIANYISGIDRAISINGNRLWRKVYGYFWRYRTNRIREMISEEEPDILNVIKKGYTKSVERTDAFVGTIIRTLREFDLLSDTLLIITSDHGDSFNEHDEISSQIEKRYEHGHFLFDNVIRVPLIFYMDNKLQPKHIENQVRTIDIVPTLIELLEIKESGRVDGSSLVSFLTGDARLDFPSHAYSEIVRNDQVEREEKRSLRTNHFKLIVDYKNNRRQLFNLKEDPREIVNIYEYNDNLHRQMEDILDKYIESDRAAEIDLQVNQEEQGEIEKKLHELGYL